MYNKDNNPTAAMNDKELEKKRAELIAKCKYYKGEKESPFNKSDEDYHNGWPWYYEQKWVECVLRDSDFSGHLRQYKAAGLEDFHKDDGVPITLKAFILLRFYYQDGDIPEDPKGFRKFYEEYY